ncbi:hypothetical protein [Dyella japonica]|uniref:Uncharacterized protein n=1 Tax=Dyella japonica TaxID=231455 RepID=A0ABV2JSH9_9GAMM
MKIFRITVFAAATLLAATAWAQNAEQPLNLKLPADLPASSASAAPPAAPATTVANSTGRPAPAANAQANTQAGAQNGSYTKDPPGTYYGDTSGAMGDTQAAVGVAPAVTCDDATYNQPQVHGAVSTGVVAGNHFSGSYTGGAVTLSQAFGSCEHPTGGVSISVGGTQGHFGR